MTLTPLEKELLEGLRHMLWCAQCAEGSWDSCEWGRAALAAIDKAEAVESAENSKDQGA